MARSGLWATLYRYSEEVNEQNKPQGRKTLRDNWPDLDDEIEALGLANPMRELRRCLDDESQTSVHTLIHIGQNMCN